MAFGSSGTRWCSGLALDWQVHEFWWCGFDSHCFMNFSLFRKISKFFGRYRYRAERRLYHRCQYCNTKISDPCTAQRNINLCMYVLEEWGSWELKSMECISIQLWSYTVHIKYPLDNCIINFHAYNIMCMQTPRNPKSVPPPVIPCTSWRILWFASCHSRYMYHHPLAALHCWVCRWSLTITPLSHTH